MFAPMTVAAESPESGFLRWEAPMEVNFPQKSDAMAARPACGALAEGDI